MAVSNTEVSVNIRGLAFGGAGVGEVTSQSDGRSDLLGISAFVPFSAAGELVSARITQRKDRYLRTELLKVINPSGDRVAPPCTYFSQCGGCELQHISYAKQLDAKFEMIRGQLRAAKLSSADIEKLQPIVPGEEYGYRRRLTLHVDAAGRVGLYREASRSVVPITSCLVAQPLINQLLTRIQDFGRLVQGVVTSILLEADDSGVVAVLKSPYDLGIAAARSVMSVAKDYFENATLLVGEKEVDGYGRLILELPLSDNPSFTLRVPAGYFSQVNAAINRDLISVVLNLADVNVGDRVLDLYAGAGNFSLPLAKAGAKVQAVECDRRLVSFGRENAQRYSLQKTLDFTESSVEQFLRVYESKTVFDLVLADPPRSGLGSVFSALPKTRRLILVSCHLPSSVRDIKNLLESGFELETIIPFDMFAQTSYVEILAAFRAVN